MTKNFDIKISFTIMALLIALVGIFQSWGVALSILNLCLISAVMSMGVNIQWGFAGLINFGVMGFLAIGGLATVLVSVPPVYEAWAAGGGGILISGLFLVLVIVTIYLINLKIPKFKYKNHIIFLIIILSIPLLKFISGPAIGRIESINAATSGFLGGANLPIILSWFIGGILSALVAFIIGKICLGLRSDYLAIATLGISEIIIAILRNEDWMTRGVKNVAGIPRPVPYEIDLQASENFVNRAASFGLDPTTASTLFVKIAYAGLFGLVLFVLVWLSQRALNSPWGRMMRAIRDNETAAQAMGKDIKSRHLQIFILGSAVCGIAGAMMTTLDAQLTPGAYQPLRFTFLIWVMVIVGGSGSNLGSILGGFLVWFLWVQVEPIGYWLVDLITAPMDPESPVRLHLLDSVAQMRLLTMGLFLLLMLRFYPRGMIPEK